MLFNTPRWKHQVKRSFCLKHKCLQCVAQTGELTCRSNIFGQDSRERRSASILKTLTNKHKFHHPAKLEDISLQTCHKQNHQQVTGAALLKM